MLKIYKLIQVMCLEKVAKGKDGGYQRERKEDPRVNPKHAQHCQEHILNRAICSVKRGSFSTCVTWNDLQWLLALTQIDY